VEKNFYFAFQISFFVICFRRHIKDKKKKKGEKTFGRLACIRSVKVKELNALKANLTRLEDFKIFFEMK
jgi:hypothetical protein